MFDFDPEKSLLSHGAALLEKRNYTRAPWNVLSYANFADDKANNF